MIEGYGQFRDRHDAGRQLAERLRHLKGEDVIVYALPRGGVEVGYEVARALGAPLGVVITRKVGHPMNPEFAICAVTETGERICNEDVVRRVDPDWLEKATRAEMAEARRRREHYAPHTPDLSPKGRVVVLVDDGIATGLTMKAAVRGLRAAGPKRLIVAVPTAPADTVAELRGDADEVIALAGTQGFLGAVGAYYQSFPQTPDETVVDLLDRARRAWEEARRDRAEGSPPAGGGGEGQG